MEGTKRKKVRILAISDTHVNHELIDIKQWPEADIFIHAGDFTITSTSQEFANFRAFLSRLPYKHKIVIAGNHDFGLEQSEQIYQQQCDKWQVPKVQRIDPRVQLQKINGMCTLLFHEKVEVMGVTIFGSPHVWLGYKLGFTEPKTTNQQIWAKFPQKLDVLITHIPPFGICDKTVFNCKVGCKRLLKVVQKIQPKVHIFGHIHEGFGSVMVGPTHFYNVCYLDEYYKPLNKPILIQVQV